MRTRLEVFQRLDSRFRGNDKQGGNDEGDALPLVPLSETRVNYAAGRSIPLVNQLGPSLGFTVEFNPPPRRTMELVAEHYRQPRNLLIRFRDDDVDQSPRLYAQLKARSEDQSRLVVRPGKCTTPVSAGLRQQILGTSEDPKSRRIKRLAHQVLVLGQGLVDSTPSPPN